MPLTNSLDNEFELLHQEGIQPSEIGNLPYWKLEAFIERLNKKNEEEKDRQRKQEEQQKKHSQSNNTNPSKYMSKLPKMPKY